MDEETALALALSLSMAETQPSSSSSAVEDRTQERIAGDAEADLGENNTNLPASSSSVNEKTNDADHRAQIDETPQSLEHTEVSANEKTCNVDPKAEEIQCTGVRRSARLAALPQSK